MTIEAWVQNSARGLYRKGDYEFSEGQAITIDPFRDVDSEAFMFWPIYGEFIEYVTDDIAKVYIPPGNDDSVWFREDAGEYLIHEGYLTPQ